MIAATRDLSAAARDGYDAIIDVRSPAEFAEDHVPGAINLPVLDDAERAEVGTIYVQTSRFLARRVGAARVARNIALHLEGALADRPKDFRPLVYCWRGGMRSGAMATVLAQVGWRTSVLEGGYRTWRRQVVDGLHGGAIPHRLVLLEGPTGAGKTAMLEALARAGEQVLDLEALARHRGSLFGAMPGGQPGQKRFESLLFDLLARADPGRPLYLEAESSRVGALSLPPALWAAMQAAPCIRLEADLPTRVRHILAHYGEIASDRELLAAAIDRLPSHHSKARKAGWKMLAAAGTLEPLVAGLIADHYDPAYAGAAGRRAGACLGTILVSGGGDFAQAARAITALATGTGDPARG